jgi:hypothetical protein
MARVKKKRAKKKRRNSFILKIPMDSALKRDMLGAKVRLYVRCKMEKVKWKSSQWQYQ